MTPLTLRTRVVAGLVLIGGRSERMGRPKVLVELDGIPLWRRAVDALAPFVSDIVFLGNVTDFAPPSPFRQIVDNPSGIGPLGGLVAGLEQSGYKHHLLMAVDYPLVPPEFLRTLCDHADGYDAVCGMNGGFVEPLVGYYHAGCAPVIRQMLQEGDSRTHRLIGRVKNLVIPEAEMLKIDPSKSTYFNVNTPSDLLEAEARLRSGHHQ